MCPGPGGRDDGRSDVSNRCPTVAGSVCTLESVPEHPGTCAGTRYFYAVLSDPKLLETVTYIIYTVTCTPRF